MKISVIIPVKNRANLLRVTLNNILSQTKKPHEIIVVNDSSTDNLPELVLDYQDSVNFFDSNGSGPGAARNTGFKKATGDLIQFFDSDDLMTCNKLMIQSETLKETGADLVYGPWVKATQSQDVWKQMDVIMQYYPLPNGEDLVNMVLQGWGPITQSVLFTRKLLESVGPWREDLMTHEDYEFWFRIAKNSKKHIHERQSCVVYRQHKNQITDQAVLNQDRWLDGIKAMEIIKSSELGKSSRMNRILFNGRLADSKITYANEFTDSSSKIASIDQLTSLYYKIHRRLGNIVSGSNWQRIHGVLPSGGTEFEKYIRMLK